MALVGAGLSMTRSRTAVHEPGDGEDPREPGHDQARARDRAQLVVYRIRVGLVRPGWLA